MTVTSFRTFHEGLGVLNHELFSCLEAGQDIFPEVLEEGDASPGSSLFVGEGPLSDMSGFSFLLLSQFPLEMLLWLL